MRNLQFRFKGSPLFRNSLFTERSEFSGIAIASYKKVPSCVVLARSYTHSVTKTHNINQNDCSDKAKSSLVNCQRYTEYCEEISIFVVFSLSDKTRQCFGRYLLNK